MCWSLPLITSDFGPLPEINHEGETGLVFETGDVEALADRIALLASDPQLRQRMGERGRQRVAREFAEERMVNDTFGIYESVVKR
jgi:glycosyltransferase involved in cell wall biosynthesis